MQRMMGYVRRAADDYQMIEAGDSIAVGVSGGKDSFALLAALHAMRRFYPLPYSIIAVTVDPCFGRQDTDYSLVTEWCTARGIPHIIKRSELATIIFDERKETNPCSLCARMRRGMLHDMAKENNCNKLALAHNRDDAVETLMMNLFLGGRLSCFQPVTYLSRKDLTMIRPLVLAPERDIIACVRRNGFPVVKSPCPVDKKTMREDTKHMLTELEQKYGYDDLAKRIFGAIRRSGIDGW